MQPSDQDPAEGSPPRFHGLNTRRFASNPVERQVAELWSAREGKGQLKKLLHDMEPSDRERAVAATVIQWLGSPVGQSFVRGLASIPGFDAAPEGSLTFTAEQVQMLRQLLGNTQLRVSMKGADLERCRKGNPLGRVLLSQWPTEKMHPFMAKVRQLLANSEKMVSDLPEIKEKPAALVVRFGDPGMRDKTVEVPSGPGGLTKVLCAEEKARNYTTAQLVAGGVTIATFYRPLGGDSFQTKLPENFER